MLCDNARRIFEAGEFGDGVVARSDLVLDPKVRDSEMSYVPQASASTYPNGGASIGLNPQGPIPAEIHSKSQQAKRC